MRKLGTLGVIFYNLDICGPCNLLRLTLLTLSLHNPVSPNQGLSTHAARVATSMAASANGSGQSENPVAWLTPLHGVGKRRGLALASKALSHVVTLGISPRGSRCAR